MVDAAAPATNWGISDGEQFGRYHAQFVQRPPSIGGRDRQGLTSTRAVYMVSTAARPLVPEV